MEGFAGDVDMVACEESMVRKEKLPDRWFPIEKFRDNALVRSTRFQAWHNGCIRGTGCSSTLPLTRVGSSIQLAPTPSPSPTGPGGGAAKGPGGKGFQVWAIQSSAVPVWTVFARQLLTAKPDYQRACRPGPEAAQSCQ